MTAISRRSNLIRGLKGWLRLGLEYMTSLGKDGTFSQFGEDAYLRSYFVRKQWLRRGGKGGIFLWARRIPKGFYVDVGAYSPKLYSNTYWFYQRGWRGINIDATPGSMRAFKLIRPRDVNLELAVSDQEGEVLLHSWGTSSVMNTVAAHDVDSRSSMQGYSAQEIRVPSHRLSTVFQTHLLPRQAIDFMSIDVEGYELAVLQSNDWELYRPELVMVEQYGESIAEISVAEATRFMFSADYSLYAWPRPNMVYRDNKVANVP